MAKKENPLEKEVPLEIAISESKDSITQYVNALCQKYRLHPAIMLQILQEIIYENRLNTMAQQMMKMRLAQAPSINLSDMANSEKVTKIMPTPNPVQNKDVE